MGNTPDLASQIVSLRATLAIPGLDPQLRAGLEATLRGLEAEQARQAAPAIHSPTAQRDVNIATQQTITNFLGSGPETPGLDLATLRREYLLSLAGACNRLSLADADSSDPARAAVELASVYTRLEVASTVPLTKKEQNERPGQQQRQLTALEALAAQPRLVLLADPATTPLAPLVDRLLLAPTAMPGLSCQDKPWSALMLADVVAPRPKDAQALK